MKANVIHQFGPPEVLKYQDVPDPQPRPGEVRIRVHAATVNRVLDVSLRAGKEMFRDPVLPLIPGVDCAGVIDAVGPGVTRRKVGERVCGGRRHAARRLPGGLLRLHRPGRHDGHQAAGRICRAGLRARLRHRRRAEGSRLPRRRRGDAPRPDRLEPAVQRRRAEEGRDRADHGRRRQSRHRRHPARQERRSARP